MSAQSPLPQPPAIPPPQVPPPRKPIDQAFLPAALEIIETPPSPVRMAMILSIAAFFAVALIWSFFGRVDVVATAPGRVQPTGRVGAIQAAEGGRVAAIDVANGSHVEAGDRLIALDVREAAADVAELQAAYTSVRAEAIRRHAALAAAEDIGGPVPELAFPADIPPALRDRESRVLQGEIGKLAAEIALVEATSLEKDAERGRLEATIAAQEALLATQSERVDMRSELMARSAGSKAQLIDAEEVRQLQQVTLATQRGQLSEARAALQRLARQRTEIVETFIAENGQKLADAERMADESHERLAKAVAQLEHMTIRAPIAGNVAALAVTGTGQVVSPGQEVMRIVPDGSKLEVEAYVSNQDIGFIHPGLAVSIKIDSFPFTRYGVLHGTVKQVARDAVARSDIETRLASPTAAPRSMGAGGTQAVQDLVFPVTVALDDPAIAVDGVRVPLTPGMSATVEIKTGSRSILDYLFSPLVEVASDSLRER
ncbi:HlyD family type I secretion periplasmic adaptor subunit [Mesorhizobium sp. BR1-1-16]|uniref:HlyD family type I secretion periplasmic adaptor subunit n=1 Tax=Mesorhizobium sp. BR1-1-16 TaxID=2876653 RepID=UPI001CCE4FED|nr:HlyD family type I secretion periplasmic adaptor subunit [Mesorhizobium sp. BR1-1-16]MBZ9935231.1 HlyD family type I secretion periplasmic adaptor subunit [Mesorhizobium sp. BR1-1-16]